MATRDFLLPDLGEGLTEGTIVRWLVSEGQTVEVDEPVAEMETAKAVVEVPSPFAGVVAARHGEEGDEVEVGQPLLSIAEADGGAETDGAETDGAETDGGEDDDSGASGNVLVGYGTDGGGRRRRRGRGARQVVEEDASGSPPAQEQPARPLAKPPVRLAAKELGVDLAEVPGTGPGGVVTRADLQAFAAGPEEDRQTSWTSTDGEAERIPMTGVRRRIAQKMTESRREIPEATSWVDCDASGLLRARASLNVAQGEDRVRVSPLALILRACVAGLGRFRELNSWLDTERDEIVRETAVHLGVAAQTERGLLVPVIRHAQQRTTLGLAGELNRLAEAARAGTLGTEELQGSTFTVSNYGSFGVDGGNPVINHPNAAILGIGRISERPWVVDGALAVRPVVQLSVAFDHRLCDGAEAAGFVRFVADCVEDPAVLLGAGGTEGEGGGSKKGRREETRRGRHICL
ncbi:MAG: dihydrolipoamide acetyltransferase family protein, partial [Egibacteraceae bacterium]